MQRPPSYLANEDALDALCHHFSLGKALYPPNTPLQPTFNMPLISQAAQMPTHVLAIVPPDGNSSAAPLMIPVDVNMYHQCFSRADLLPSFPGRASTHSPLRPWGPTPHHHPARHSYHGAARRVPPLLFLFGLGLETDLNLLASRILPPDVIGEFPNAAAMATVMSRLREPQFEWYLRYNQGIWKNVLALAPRNTALVELVQTAWNVTADARRIRLRLR
ncbi:hypothetical protein B0H10DRAFT_2164121 [Mycena sp. CBHHK59/15]|nr:hypothetical protein B0H10DRAFT_2164121 [Mycena sp. CBHHK59/15]